MSDLLCSCLGAIFFLQKFTGDLHHSLCCTFCRMASGILLMFVLHNTVSKHIRPNVEVIRAFSLEGAVLAKAISRLVRGTGVVVTPPQRRYAFLFLQNYLGMEVGPTSHVASMERLRQLLVGKRFHISLHRYKLYHFFRCFWHGRGPNQSTACQKESGISLRNFLGVFSPF